jgi:acyl-CoA thioesterase
MSTPQDVAQACGDAMRQADRASAALGMHIASIGPGTAVLTMTVRADMLNGLQTCHGGLVATLADSAFAFACNSYNEATVASGFDIHLVAAAQLADVLTATAHEVSRSGRTGVYDVTVNNQRGDTVAVFRGRSYAIKGKALVDGLPVGKLK